MLLLFFSYTNSAKLRKYIIEKDIVTLYNIYEKKGKCALNLK